MKEWLSIPENVFYAVTSIICLVMLLVVEWPFKVMFGSYLYLVWLFFRNKKKQKGK